MKTLILLAALAAAPPALAAQAIATSVEDLARQSDAVVRGRVAKTTSRWSDGGKRIFTYVELESSSSWRGSAPPRPTIIVPGGIVGDVGQRVDGVATFNEGEEVVVFLGRAEGGSFRVRGLAQGKFKVEGDKVKPDLSRTTLVTTALRRGERRAEEMTVGELERRVRSAR